MEKFSHRSLTPCHGNSFLITGWLVKVIIAKKMPAGDYLKGKYSKRPKTVMRLLREGHLSQTKIARKVGVSKQRVWMINKSYLKAPHSP